MDGNLTGKELAVIATALAFQIADTLSDDQIDRLIYFMSSLTSQIVIASKLGIQSEDEVQPPF